MIKSRLRWARHVAWTGVLWNAYSILTRKPDGRPLGRPTQTPQPRLKLKQILNRVWLCVLASSGSRQDKTQSSSENGNEPPGSTKEKQLFKDPAAWSSLKPNNISYLLVMPSAEISCILQHADTILMASWSTTSTRHSIPCPGFLLFLIASFIISIKTQVSLSQAHTLEYWNFQNRDNSCSKMYASV